MRNAYLVIIVSLVIIFCNGCATPWAVRRAKGYPSPKFDDVSHIAAAWVEREGRWLAVLVEGSFERPGWKRERYERPSSPARQALWIIDGSRLAKVGSNLTPREFFKELEGGPPFKKAESGLRRGLKAFGEEWGDEGAQELEVPLLAQSGWLPLPVLDLRGIDNAVARGEEMRRIAATKQAALFMMASVEDYARHGNFFVVFSEFNPAEKSVSLYRVELDPGQIPPRPAWWLATPFTAVWDVVIVLPFMLLSQLLGAGSTSIAVFA